MPAIETESFDVCAEIKKREQQRLLTQLRRALQVHEVAPGHFKPTSSERIDKMYKEVGDYLETQVGYFDAVVAVLLSVSTLRFICASLFLKVHDFAQGLKECERQLKQLETASAGLQSM